MFIYQPFTLYINGDIKEEQWAWDVDTMSYIDLKKLINALRYKSFNCWHRNPRLSLHKGLKPHFNAHNNHKNNNK